MSLPYSLIKKGRRVTEGKMMTRTQSEFLSCFQGYTHAMKNYYDYSFTSGENICFDSERTDLSLDISL